VHGHLPVFRSTEKRHGQDPCHYRSVPENNSARALVGVEGSKPVHRFGGGINSGLVKLLRGGNVEVIGKTPEKCNWVVENFRIFLVILEMSRRDRSA